MKKPQPSKNILFFLLLFIVISADVFAQSNTCGGATQLFSGSSCTTTSGTTTGSSNVALANDCGANSGTRADVWYYFVALQSDLVITLTKTDAGGGQRRFQVLQGSCPTPTTYACSGDNDVLGLTGLTINQTYFIRVYSNNTTQFNFNICITNPPTNDNCANARTLTPAYTCTGTSQLTGQTLENSSPTPGITGACGSTSSPDVWYQFTANSTRPTITVSSLGSSWSTNLRIQLLSRTGPCTGLTELRCVSNAPLTPTADLIPGDVYYIRICKSTATGATGTNWGFDICVTDAPVNDHCTNAVTVTPTGKCNPTAGNLYGATQTNPAGSSCGNRYDVWYKFTLPNNPEATYASIGLTFTSSTSALTNGNTYIELFNSSNCSVDNTSLGCTNLNNNNNPRSYIGLTPGATYYFRINTSANTNNNPSNWAFNVCVTTFEPFSVGSSGRMREVFQQTVLSPPGILLDPWEVTYGRDNKLWITEAKGYKVYRMDPATGAKTTVLDVSQGSVFFSAPADVAFNCQFNNGAGAQGGFAGLVLHPNFLDGTASEKNFVYVSYVHDDSSNASYFRNRVVRFTYNTGTNRLESPVSLCDTLPGSNDHNSQRMIIAPITPGGPKYLFYASGDMGAGQGNATNVARPIKAQYPDSYEGKILRFNLETDGESGLDGWIPNDNPYSTMLGVQSAVWNIGIRNNQGFAYDTTLNILYGSSHGPYSDDEINILEPFRNYGHPLVIGYVADGNYDGTMTPSTSTSYSAGTPFGNNSGNSSCPPIGSEATRRAEIDANGNGLYKDPLFSAYPGEAGVGAGTVAQIWSNTTTPNNGTWPSEGWSGLDLYTDRYIPGWKKSLIAASLKWGRLVRLKLGATGTATLPNNDIHDTISYFGSQNRFRDIAFDPNGKDIYVIMDRSTTTSGPSALFPVVPSCPGCVQKYRFLGYADNAGVSSIPDEIDVTSATTNITNAGTTVIIDATNSNLWVPITGPDGNIMAEIYANGQNLGTITSSFYQHSGPIRIKGSIHYLNRGITINPSTAPTSPVKVRFYISKTEYDALDADVTSSLSAPNQLRIFKNSDANASVMTAATTNFYPHIIGLRGTSSDAYVLQSDTISSFSTFYFAAAPATLPVDLISFTGALQNDNTVLLKWKTENEINTSHFVVERSIDGNRFSPIGTVSANGNGATFNYAYNDADAANQSSAKLYYRLKMVDLDAKYSYSDIVTITLPYISGNVAAYPNPFATELKIAIGAPQDGRIQWKLFDNNGRTVLHHAEKVRKGNNTITINVNKLSAGFYYLSINGAGIDRKVKLQKQ